MEFSTSGRQQMQLSAVMLSLRPVEVTYSEWRNPLLCQPEHVTTSVSFFFLSWFKMKVTSQSLCIQSSQVESVLLSNDSKYLWSLQRHVKTCRKLSQSAIKRIIQGHSFHFPATVSQLLQHWLSHYITSCFCTGRSELSLCCCDARWPKDRIQV